MERSTKKRERAEKEREKQERESLKGSRERGRKKSWLLYFHRTLEGKIGAGEMPRV